MTPDDGAGVSTEAEGPPPMTDTERAEALTFLRGPDLLGQVAKDIDALGFVGEDTNKRLLYLVAISRKLLDPLSAIVLSQSGAGKSGLTEVIERLCPPEDVVLFTRLTPQSLSTSSRAFSTRSSSSSRNATARWKRTTPSASSRAARSSSRPRRSRTRRRAT